MDASRIGSGRVQLQHDDVVINDVAERAVESVRHLMDERGHELTVVLPPDPIWLKGDAVRLEQIIINLLANAAKYTDDGGRISLSVERQSQECTLRVRDTGTGILAELLPRVFDLVTQAEPTLDRSKGGYRAGARKTAGRAASRTSRSTERFGAGERVRCNPAGGGCSLRRNERPPNRSLVALCPRTRPRVAPWRSSGALCAQRDSVDRMARTDLSASRSISLAPLVRRSPRARAARRGS
jgi:hypothetical protein